MTSDYLPAVEVTVADVDGVPAGLSPDSRHNSLERIFVDDAHRGRGIGSALLEPRARAAVVILDLVLDVNEQNPQAVGFFTNARFVNARQLGDRRRRRRPFPILHMARSTY